MPLTGLPSLMLLFVGVLVGGAMAREPTMLARLANNLLQNYTVKVRPVRNWTSTTNVFLDFSIYAILKVDVKNQMVTTYLWYREYWLDRRLSWDPSQYEYVERLSLPISRMWSPDIVISELVEEDTSLEVPYVYVNSTGFITHLRPLRAVTTCILNIFSFPFDKQNCSLTFAAWTYTASEVTLVLRRTIEQLRKDRFAFVSGGEWELLDIVPYLWLQKKDGKLYSQFRFNMIIKRRPLFYVVNLLVPSLILMIVDLAGFLLPPECGERVSFKVTILLGYFVFLTTVVGILPATAQGTPLIGVYFVVCIALLVISLLETVLVLRVLYGHQENNTAGVWTTLLISLGFSPDNKDKSLTHTQGSENSTSNNDESGASSTLLEKAYQLDKILTFCYLLLISCVVVGFVLAWALP
uniref:5-hydroxytryptamine receptor 3A n=2 Tax=Eptatretus burgeri TaxID=7764 RepID=A0A8C4QI47_EPTBU